MLNKGFMGLINFEGTPLEYKDEDKFVVACLKGAGQGTIEGLLVLGSMVVVVSALASKNKGE